MNGPAWTSSSNLLMVAASLAMHGGVGWIIVSLLVRFVMVDQSDSAEGVGGSSTALSAMRAEEGQASEPSTSSVAGAISSSSDTPGIDGPSEGGVHGWWLDRDHSSPSLSAD